MWSEMVVAAAVAVVPLVPAPAAAQQPAQRARPTRAEAAVPFRVGETLTYDVSWSAFLVAGTATTTVTEKRPSMGSTAYAVVAEGRPLPAVARLFTLYYKLETSVDSFNLLSQRSSVYSEEGDRRETAITTFDRRARKATFERRRETVQRETFPITTQTQDSLAMLYALRALSLAPGGRIEIPVTNDGAMFRVNVDVSGPERLSVPFGTVDALRLKLAIRDADGQPVGRDAVIWLSADARHLPVKLQAELPIGSFVLALREAK